MLELPEVGQVTIGSGDEKSKCTRIKIIGEGWTDREEK